MVLRRRVVWGLFLRRRRRIDLVGGRTGLAVSIGVMMMMMLRFGGLTMKALRSRLDIVIALEVCGPEWSTTWMMGAS